MNTKQHNSLIKSLTGSHSGPDFFRTGTDLCRKTVIMVAATMIAATTTGQTRQNQELTFSGGAGLSTLTYTPVLGAQKNKFGGNISIGYNYLFSEQMGIGTGLELSFFNAEMTCNQYNDNYTATDIDGDTFDFRSTVTDYKEKQNATYLNIPLMYHYRTTGKNIFYANAGAKIGIPLSGKYKTSGATIRNSGYYSEDNYEYTDQEFMGFGTFTNRDTDKGLNYKVVFFLSAEAGLKWPLTDELSLYTGAYIDYGLNDIRKDVASERLVAYNTASPRDFTTNSVFTSRNKNNEALTGNVKPLAAGIKITLAYTLGGKKKKPQSMAKAALSPVPDEHTEQTRKEAEEEATRREAEIKRLSEQLAEQQEKERQQQQLAAGIEDALTILRQPVSGYETNQVTPMPEQQQELDKKIILLQQYPEWTIICEGHTCDLGGKNTNENIALKRAEAVRDYMVEHAISKDRITVISKGESEPLVPNTDEGNRRENRRVVIIVVK
ncbi:MAG: OmpA family protein [Candidatus Azobacteroides sp.]|nr:OmpA family protein [Candidatus Azobacteroides sp.]